MATFTNTNKSSASTWTKPNEISADYGLINQVKAGLGWLYNQVGITYNSEIDSISGNEVLYNGLGTATVWTTQNES